MSLNLLDSLSDVVNVLEKLGDRIFLDAAYRVHYEPNVLKGLFWYNVLSDEIRYSFTLDSHDQFEDYDTLRHARGWIRGKIGEIDQKKFIFVYADDFPMRQLTGKVLKAIYHAVVRMSGLEIDYVVDQFGHDLVGEVTEKLEVRYGR